MSLILDTDILTLLNLRSQPASDRFMARLQQSTDKELCSTIVNFQERVLGWTSFLRGARSPEQIVHAYSELLVILQDFCALRVLPFDKAAQDRFSDLQKQRLRLGTLDLRIASIALTTGSTLLSRNLSDFRRISGLIVEDWTY